MRMTSGLGTICVMTAARPQLPLSRRGTYLPGNSLGPPLSSEIEPWNYVTVMNSMPGEVAVVSFTDNLCFI